MITTILGSVVCATLSQVGGLDMQVRVGPKLPAEVMADVSADRVKATVDRLASFGTRHTLSDVVSDTRGIGAARRWIKSELSSYGGSMSVAFEEFEAPASQRIPRDVKVVNVIAVIKGTVTPERAFYVVGHYDSRNGDSLDDEGDAPGANDDASGTAVVMEVARVLSRRPLESTVIFLCTAAEEQGLIGAKFHADQAAGENANWTVCGVLNNDIVGDPYGWKDRTDLGPLSPRWKVRVFSEGLPRNPSAEEMTRLRSLSAEGDSSSRQLARYVSEVAEWEGTRVRPKLVYRLDRFLRGGDHSAFNDRGFAAVRFSVPHEDYTRQHANVTEKNGRPYGDMPEFVDGEYLADVTRLNAAAIVHLANAPAAPSGARVVTAALTNDTVIRWDKNSESDVKGYEVVWRETTSAVWTHSLNVGDVKEFQSELSKDDVFFGVRAYDKDGYRSPVTFCGVARE